MFRALLLAIVAAAAVVLAAPAGAVIHPGTSIAGVELGGRRVRFAPSSGSLRYRAHSAARSKLTSRRRSAL